jgi:hypothetical protein
MAHSIQVEDQLFKIHRAAFNGSPVFEQMFSLPQIGVSDGSNKEHPLILNGLTVDGFRAFARAASSRCVMD